MARYIQAGHSLDVKNDTGTDIKAGEVVQFDTRIGIAGTNITTGATGAVHMVGVFEIDKQAGLEISQGENVYFDGTVITKDSADTPAGYAAYDSDTTASTVMVKLLG